MEVDSTTQNTTASATADSQLCPPDCDSSTTSESQLASQSQSSSSTVTTTTICTSSDSDNLDSGNSDTCAPQTSKLTLEHSFSTMKNNGHKLPGPSPTTTTTAIKPIRFSQVPGFELRKSDIFYLPPVPSGSTQNGPSTANSTTPTAPKLLVYFGGDIQEAPEIMELGPEPRKFLTWNLENICTLLHEQFPESHVVIFRPCRMETLTYSCFSNFVPCNDRGVPEHVINHNGLRHLEEVLKSLSQLVAIEKEDEDGEIETSGTATLNISGEKIQFNRADISLVGFSKGCVVLNQFLYEFHYLKTLTPDDTRLDPFLSSIKDMYFLDGGHSGGKNTWITARSLLETLVRLSIRVHVHVTPYQIHDDRRPWIRREEKAFSDSIKKYGGWIQRYIHFQHEPGTIENHFKLLSTFSRTSGMLDTLLVDEDDYYIGPFEEVYPGGVEDEDDDGVEDDL